MAAPKTASAAWVTQQAGRLSGVCTLLRSERKAVPGNTIYSYVATVEECAELERAVKVLERIAARRS